MKPLTIRIRKRVRMRIIDTPEIDKPHYWFTINGGNGKVIVTSETYTSKQSAWKMIDRLTGEINNVIFAKVMDETREK